MSKFKRMFVPHPSFRFDTAPLLKLADEIVYVCGSPMFDDLTGPENADRFEGSIARAMKGFDPKYDAIGFYGDAIVFAMMVAFLYVDVIERGDKLKVARYSRKANEYTVREVDEEAFYKTA